MTKKISKTFSILITVCMLVSLVPAVSYAAEAGTTFTAGNFTYKVNTDTSTVTLTAIAASALSGDVTVPQTVSDGTSTYTVTALGDAFKNQGAKTNDMTSLVLPDTITTLTGTASFYGCKFTSIHLPSALTGQSNNAGYLWNTFMYCSKLASVELPVGITKCYGTFRNSAVKTVTITGTASVDFFAGSTTNEARAWTDGTTGITIWYPANGTAPARTSASGSFTATVQQIVPEGVEFTYGDFNYKTTGASTVTLISIAASALSGNVTVPQTVSDGTNTYTVTALGDAFKNQGAKTNGMTGLTLPDTITKFTGTATFYGCKFTSIHLPSALTGQSNNAGYLWNTFMYCTQLTNVTLPAGITKCYGSFRNSAVKTVTITGTASVDFFGSAGTSEARAWTDGTTGITIYYPAGGAAPTRTGTSFTATVVALTPTFTDGNFTYKANADGTTAKLTTIVDKTVSGPVTVPQTATDGTTTYTVTEIGAQAFNGANAITSLTLPNTITTIGYQAFMDMKALVDFDMPDSVTQIGYGLFYACNNLETVELSKNLTGLMQTTFAYCSKLQGCVIPDGVTTLNKTFMYCNIIKTVYVPSSVTVITGDDGIKNALFSTFDTDGVITGAPTEPGFVVMGESGTAIEDYMFEKGWNFVPVDADMPLAVTAPKPHDDGTVTIDIINFNDTDKTASIDVFCGFFNRITNRLDDVGMATLSNVDAAGMQQVTIEMNNVYDDTLYYARSFVWENGSIAPFADFGELY